MSTSQFLNQDSTSGSRRFQSSSVGVRSQSSDRFFNPTTSYTFQPGSLSQSISPQSLSQTLSPPQGKPVSCEEQLEVAQRRIKFLTAELDRVNKLNQELTNEIEILRKPKGDLDKEDSLTNKLAVILAENAKLNHALEKLREGYEKEKTLNDRISDLASQPEHLQGLTASELGNTQRLNVDRGFSSQGFEQRSGLSTPHMGSKIRGNLSEAKSHITNKDKKEEDYERTIVTLFVENDKLNDALEQKMREVHSLAAKLEDQQAKSTQEPQKSSNQHKKKDQKGNETEERESVSLSQDFSGMINNLLQENGKLVEIINKKDQELNELKQKLPKSGKAVVSGLDESFGTEAQSEPLTNMKKNFDEILTRNETINKILNAQNVVTEGYKQSIASVEQVRTNTSQIIEENLKVNQLVSDRMNSLREDLSNALGALPVNVQELRAQVNILSQEKENLNNVIRDQFMEIGALKHQLTQSKSRSGNYALSGTTTDEVSDESGNRLTSLGEFEREREVSVAKNIMNEIQTSSTAQRDQFEELRNKLDGLTTGIYQLIIGSVDPFGNSKAPSSAGLSTSSRIALGDVSNIGQRSQDSLTDKIKDFEGLKTTYSDIKSSLSDIQSNMKRDENMRVQIATLIQENQRANQATKEKEKVAESLVQQLKKLQEVYTDSMKEAIQGKNSEDNFDNLFQRIEEVRMMIGSTSEENSVEAKEVKENIGYVLDELAQLKMDFVNYHMEIKSMRSQASSDKKAHSAEEEHLRGMVQSLMQEKEQFYKTLRQKDSEFEQLRAQKYELSEKISSMMGETKGLERLLENKDKEINSLNMRISMLQEAELKLIDLQQKIETANLEREMQLRMNLPGETPVRSVAESSFSEESTPVKAQIKRRPLTEEEAIVQENFQGKIDIVFCMDCTASMDPYIENAKLACEKIMNVMIQSKNNFPLDLMFGFVGYRDHGSYNANTWVTKVQELCDIETCLNFINQMDAKSSSDNDFPEAVMPALWDCCEKVNWRDSTREKVLRVVFHIADAPPHGKRFYKGKNDKYPKGDPSGIRTEQIAQRFADLNIQYKLLKIGKFLDLMDKVFKHTFLDMESMELKKAEHLDQMTTAILVRQLDTINNEISIKDKRFLNVAPKGDLKRSEKIGQCYFTSVLFDDYVEYFLEENITGFKVRTLNLFYTQEAIVGIQCVYVTDEEEIEAPARIAQNNGAKQVSLELGMKEYITEVSGEVDARENLVSLYLCTNLNKKIRIGGHGVRKFRVNVPASGYSLAAIGGSYRNRGIDSLYFYYV